MGMNNYSGIGNCTRDAEMRYTPGGKAILNVGVAVNEKRKNDRGEWEDASTFFVDVEAWEQTAERYASQITKGTKIFFSGKLKTDQWKDKQSGENRQKTVCTAHEIFPVPRWDERQEDSSGRGNDDRSQPRNAPQDRGGGRPAQAPRGQQQQRGGPPPRGQPQGRGAPQRQQQNGGGYQQQYQDEPASFSADLDNGG